MKLFTFAVTLLLPAFAIAQGAGDLCENGAGVRSLSFSFLAPILSPSNFAHLLWLQQVGICESTTWCDQTDGVYTSGLCPNAPSYVKCCFFPHCNGGNGYCISTKYACTGGKFIKYV